MRFIRLTVALLLIASNAVSIGLVVKAQGQKQSALVRDTNGQIVFSIPLGDDGLHYEGGDKEETEVIGPASLRIAPDGTILITDTLAGRILKYSTQGKKTATFNVDGSHSVTDAVSDGYNLFVLDEAAAEPSVYRLSSEGQAQTRIALPNDLREKGLSGLWKSDDGEILAEVQGGSSVIGLDGSARDGKSVKGEHYTMKAPDLNDVSSDHSNGLILRNGEAVSVKVNNILGGMTLLGSGPQRDFFILVEELSNTHKLAVDQTVRHYNAAGKLIEVARVPLAERYTYVRNGVALAPDGNVYALVTRKDRVDVVRLQFKQSINSILPEAETPNEQVAMIGKADKRRFAHALANTAMPQTSCARTRDQMINTAWTYINNQTYLTVANLSGTCAGRLKPRYLGTSAGYYNSVPYDWGGYDTVAQFNNYMGQGYQAGDLDTNGTESCSRGVDCSGFVSQAWGTSRYTTSSLPNISTEISVSQLQRGDIINLAGSHVAMFASLSNGGVNTLEATAYNNYDRVVALWNGWSRFNGYRFYRYNSVCDSTASGPVVSSSLRLSSSGPYYVGQTLYGYFTITNRGTASITLSRLLIGGRLNGDQSCSGGCPDFSSVSNITLSPGQSYSYSGSRYLDRSGNYSFFVSYQKTDGTWVTNVATENGTISALGITVQSAVPKLTGKSPTYIYASPYDQTVYFYGTALTKTDYMYVQFPSGGTAYIYPPTQIFSRTYDQLGCKIKFGVGGQYYVWTHTADGGWSNAYAVWVY
jgi:hypothetical protein